MTTARTTVDRVRHRLGSDNVDSDVTDETISEFILDASAFIERQSQEQTFGSLDTDLVRSIVTDLACAKVCLHMASGKFYGGSDYRLGPWSTQKAVGGKQLIELAKSYMANVRDGLKVLGNSAVFRFACG